MTKQKANIVHKLRVAAQIVFVLLFFYLLFGSGRSSSEDINSTSVFFYIDPLLPILNFLSTGSLLIIFMFSGITLLLSLLLGRFFCGWICPFGSINHLFSWLAKKKRNGIIPLKYLSLKYFILAALLVSALMGTNLGGWLDPFSLLTRSSAALASPAEYLLGHTNKLFVSELASDFARTNPAIKSAEELESTNIERTTTQPLVIIGLFVFFLFMNFYQKRFYCNTICPLGALLGLISRVSLYRVKSTPECISCDKCSGNCTYGGNPDDEFYKSECTVCFNCATDCNNDTVEYKFELPKKADAEKVDFGRRKMIGAAAVGLVVAALPKSDMNASTISRHNYMRPPGSINEDEFIDKCLRCGQCVQSCPTNFIQPALAATGIGGIWTPVLNAKAGYCKYDCNNCTKICPSKAIEKLSIKQKQFFKLGTAIIDKNRCYTYADGMNCTVCYDACPTKEKAIQLRKAETWNFQGKLKTVDQIYILPDKCIGCGLCEYLCPRGDEPGIQIAAEDEIRERLTGNVRNFS